MDLSKLQPHPAHKSGIMPSQVSGLFYSRRAEGNKIFVARGAALKKFPTSRGTGLLFYNSQWKLGVVNDGNKSRLMTMDELSAAAEFVTTRLLAVEQSQSEQPESEQPEPEPSTDENSIF